MQSLPNGLHRVRVALVLSRESEPILWSWIVTWCTRAHLRSLNSAFGVRKRPLEHGAAGTIFYFSTLTMYNTYRQLLGCFPESTLEPTEGTSRPILRRDTSGN